MLVVLHTLKVEAVLTKLPLINRPVEFTHSLFVPPGAMITVLVKLVEPTSLPKMMFELPVVTAQPALQPMNMLLQAVVL
jgi:hypothetical protein